MTSKTFIGFDKNPENSNGNGNGNTNLPSARPTQSTFPPTDNTGRPGSTAFVPPSASGTYSTDGGSSAGDFSTTPFGGLTYPETSPNVRPSSPSSDDLYTIKNTFPTTYPSNNRNPQTEVSPTRPPDTNHPPPSTNNNKIPPQIPPNSFEPDRPNIHHPYPSGPDPFPGYHPHVQPHYHYNLDHDFTDDKDSHFPGTYAHNAPSLHDRYYPQPPPSHIDHYGSGGLYAAGRYPETEINLGYGGNRKNGYQVTDNSPDIPMTKSE